MKTADCCQPSGGRLHHRFIKEGIKQWENCPIHSTTAKWIGCQPTCHRGLRIFENADVANLFFPSEKEAEITPQVHVISFSTLIIRPILEYLPCNFSILWLNVHASLCLHRWFWFTLNGLHRIWNWTLMTMKISLSRLSLKSWLTQRLSLKMVCNLNMDLAWLILSHYCMLEAPRRPFQKDDPSLVNL